LFEADAVGDAHELMRAQPAILGQPAMHGFTGEATLDPVDRIAEHALAQLPSTHAGADRGDLAGDIEPHDRRHRNPDPRHAAPGEHIVIIERGGAHPQHNIALARHRIGEIRLKAQPVVAMLAQHQSSHLSTPSNRAARSVRARRSILLVPASGSSARNHTRRGCR
jgi:hypothetical protein